MQARLDEVIARTQIAPDPQGRDPADAELGSDAVSNGHSDGSGVGYLKH